MMHNILNICALSLLIASATSCKPAENEPVTPLPASSFSATVDGKAFYAEEISGNITGSSFTIHGIRNPGNSKAATIVLSVPHYAGLTTYTIDTSNSADYTELGTKFNAATGNIVVTTNNNVHTAGTFSFEALSPAGLSKTITNGKFDVYK